VSKAEGKQGTVKEDLSRQEYTFGAKMIAKLKKMKCIVFGLRGAGIETAKNLLLAGPHTVVVHDDEKAQMADLGTNFYLSDDDVKAGKSRAKACEAHLAEINPMTYFRVHSGPYKLEYLESYDVVVYADDTPLERLAEINDFCHKKGIKFIHVTLFALTISIFSDFAEDHEIYDPNGETERSFVVDKVEIVPKPFQNIKDLLLFTGMDEKKYSQLKYKEKNKAAIDVLRTKGNVKLDEKRAKSISTTELLVLADEKLSKGRSMCGKITTVQRHLLSDGDHVKITEINMSKQTEAKGSSIFKLNDKISNVNSICELKTHRSNPTVFYIGNISGLGSYSGGGIGVQVKLTKKASYKSLRDQIDNPSFETGVANMPQLGEEGKVHLAWLAIQTFKGKFGRYPKYLDTKDAEACVKIAKDSKAAKNLFSFDDAFIQKMAMFCQTETNALASIAGGIVAQEVMKYTGKYTPIKQWIHYHSMQLIDTKKAGKPIGSRYDHYLSLFGESFVKSAKEAKFFLVGCGALGCEFLKNIALTGLGCSEKGEVHITDDDIIELSNLSRQFLFRRRHIGALKSKSAAGAAIEMNPELKKGLKLHTTRVEPKTEAEFSDKFWGSLDFVVNALDNLKARHYVDTKCILFGKPLFESGTLGTQANQTVHIPHKTPCYQAGAPPGEGQGIAMCTMTNFPYEPLHCIEWSRMMFGQTFEDGPSAYEDLRKSGIRAYLEKTGKNIDEEHSILKKTLKWVKIATTRTLRKCVELTMEHFTQYFRDDVKNLIHAFPENSRVQDKKTKEDKGPFWHGRRRFPRPHEFDTSNHDHVEFVYRTTSIYASIFGLEQPGKEEVISLATEVRIPQWKPKDKMDIEIDEDKEKKEEKKSGVSDDEYEEIKAMRKEVEAIDISKLANLHPAEFEKDDDTNHHVDWITSASNLRGWTRRLEPSTRAHCRMVAGRIIAAIATATAAITGFVFLEIYKLIMKTEDPNEYRWSTINLATNVFAIELPADPVESQTREEKYTVEEAGEIKNLTRKITCVPKTFTVYDFIEMKEGKDITLESFVKKFKETHSLKITMLTKYGKSKKGKMLYQEINSKFYENQKKFNERMLRMMKNALQKQRVQKALDGANAMLAEAEKQKSMTILESYKAQYGEFEDPKRTCLVLSASVEPTDRELGDGETIDIPPIKFYFA